VECADLKYEVLSGKYTHTASLDIVKCKIQRSRGYTCNGYDNMLTYLL